MSFDNKKHEDEAKKVEADKVQKEGKDKHNVREELEAQYQAEQAKLAADAAAEKAGHPVKVVNTTAPVVQSVQTKKGLSNEQHTHMQKRGKVRVINQSDEGEIV